jgi:phosphoglycolate phosphatase-like HAD superfamily hydrolase
VRARRACCSGAQVSSTAHFGALRAQRPSSTVPGVREVLDRLVENRRRVAIVTNMPLWMAEPMLERTGLQHALPIVVTHRRAGRAKPHPDQLLSALSQLRVSPRDAWYVGDMPNDCLAAHAASVRFAWAAYGEGLGCPEGADAVITRFDQVDAL